MRCGGYAGRVGCRGSPRFRTDCENNRPTRHSSVKLVHKRAAQACQCVVDALLVPEVAEAHVALADYDLAVSRGTIAILIAYLQGGNVGSGSSIRMPYARAAGRARCAIAKRP